MLALRGGGETVETMVEPPLEAAQTAAEGGEEAAASVQTPTQAVVCWYEDGDGYLVPVTRQIPKQDGIAGRRWR